MIRDMQNVNDDVITMKRLIKQKLIEDRDILEALNNKELDIDSPDDFLNENIYGFVRIPKTQDTVRNFICFTVDDVQGRDSDFRNNNVMKRQIIQFHAICHLDDMETEYGIDRHDLISYAIRDRFNWTNLFGLQFRLIENKESTVDSNYYCRTLIFEAKKPNSLNKARMDNPYDSV